MLVHKCTHVYLRRLLEMPKDRTNLIWCWSQYHPYKLLHSAIRWTQRIIRISFRWALLKALSINDKCQPFSAVQTIERREYNLQCYINRVICYKGGPGLKRHAQVTSMCFNFDNIPCNDYSLLQTDRDWKYAANLLNHLFTSNWQYKSWNQGK